MRAFDFVGVDFELGFGVDARVVRKQNIFVLLVGICVLRFLMDVNFSPKNRARRSSQNSFVEFVAGAMGFGVFKQGVVIDLLGSCEGVKSIDGGFAAFAAQVRAYVVANKCPAECKIVKGHPAAAPELCLKIGDVQTRCALQFEADTIHAGIVAGDDFCDCIGKIGLCARSRIGFDN